MSNITYIDFAKKQTPTLPTLLVKDPTKTNLWSITFHITLDTPEETLLSNNLNNTSLYLSDSIYETLLQYYGLKVIREVDKLINKHYTTLKEKHYTHATIVINFNDYNLNHEYLFEIILIASYDNKPYLKRDLLPIAFHISFIPEYIE